MNRPADLSPDQLAMFDRLTFAARLRQDGKATGQVVAVMAHRQAALRALADRGIARCWPGVGAEAGLLVGELIRTGPTPVPPAPGPPASSGSAA